MSATTQLITLILPDTVATRSYPFTRDTLDQIKDLREQREDQLMDETGKPHLVPAPVVIADAIALMHRNNFK